jgi:hypothetical protein
MEITNSTKITEQPLINKVSLRPTRRVFQRRRSLIPVVPSAKTTNIKSAGVAAALEVLKQNKSDS